MSVFVCVCSLKVEGRVRNIVRVYVKMIIIVLWYVLVCMLGP